MTIREDVIKKMKEIGCSEERIEHSIAVSDLALKIVGEMENEGIKIDKELVEKGALLHDIGYIKSRYEMVEIPEYGDRGLKIPAYHDLVRHQQVGAQMIEAMGFPKPIALIALRHDALILKNDERRRLKIEPVPLDDFSAKTFEEKAVLYADMLTFLQVMGLNPWSDWKSIREKFLPLTRYVSQNAGDQSLNEILIDRIEEQLNKARRFLKKEFFF